MQIEIKILSIRGETW